jgi:hypothetical protein
MIRGQRIYVNSGELAFDMGSSRAGTFPCIFLETVYNEDGTVYGAKFLNQFNKIDVTPKSLISNFNI